MRTVNSIKNIVTGISLQIITILLGFISRSIFINSIGIEMLGMNGLLSNILSMLSLVELGVGSAILYSLYKPLAKKNEGQIKAIMNLYSKLYKFIGITVAILGLVIMPFVKYTIGSDISSGYAIKVYFIFLANSVLSYFLSYRRNILSADQQSYILNKLSAVFSISTTLIQILIISKTKNYILYLIINLVLSFTENLMVYFITNKKYPYLKTKSLEPLDEDIKQDIIKNAKAIFLVKVAVYFVYGTDNMLLSSFCGIAVVGLYSNYSMLISTINSFISQVFNGITSSFGNFLVEKSNQEAVYMFDVLYFINFYITTFCATSLIVLLNPFINIWLGEDMLLPMIVVVVIVFNFYTRSMTSALETVRTGAGLYSPYPFFKYWSFVEGLSNLIISIILAGPLKLGMLGIFLGTSISNHFTVFLLPYHVYKYVFNMPSKQFYTKHFVNTIISASIVFITYISSSLFVSGNIFVDFIIKCFVCLTIPNIILLLISKNKEEFKYLLNRFNIKEKIIGIFA